MKREEPQVTPLEPWSLFLDKAGGAETPQTGTSCEASLTCTLRSCCYFRTKECLAKAVWEQGGVPRLAQGCRERQMLENLALSLPIRWEHL